jgi:hypothetical protein
LPNVSKVAHAEGTKRYLERLNPNFGLSKGWATHIAGQGLSAEATVSPLF